MLVGGAQESGLGTNEVEVIDLTGQGLSCDSLSPFPYDIEEASSVTLDGIVYICGGYGTNFTDTYQIYGACYKFEGNDWIWVSDLLEPRRRAAAVAMDGFIWIAGGFNEALQTSKTSEIIFPNGTVIWGTQMPIPLEWHCMNPVTDTKVILSGGFNSQFGSTRRTLLFDFTDSSWTELDQMTDQRYGHSCEIIQSAERGSEILVAGGGSVTSSTESFNLNSKKWTIGPHLPKGIAFSTSVPFNDTMVLIGGEVYGEEGYNSLYEYDPSNESWILRPETISGTKFKASAEVLGASDVSCTLLK